MAVDWGISMKERWLISLALFTISSYPSEDYVCERCFPEMQGTISRKNRRGERNDVMGQVRDYSKQRVYCSLGGEVGEQMSPLMSNRYGAHRVLPIAPKWSNVCENQCHSVLLPEEEVTILLGNVHFAHHMDAVCFVELLESAGRIWGREMPLRHSWIRVGWGRLLTNSGGFQVVLWDSWLDIPGGLRLVETMNFDV